MRHVTERRSRIRYYTIETIMRITQRGRNERRHWKVSKWKKLIATGHRNWYKERFSLAIPIGQKLITQWPTTGIMKLFLFIFRFAVNVLVLRFIRFYSSCSAMRRKIYKNFNSGAPRVCGQWPGRGCFRFSGILTGRRSVVFRIRFYRCCGSRSFHAII